MWTLSRAILVAPVVAVLACSPDAVTVPGGDFRGAVASPEAVSSEVGPDVSLVRTGDLHAQGEYKFTIPADFNGGIFGAAVGNHVVFNATRTENKGVSGRFRYVQTVDGEDFVFSGSITCLAYYDTPVLQRFPEIPTALQNRAKWGGVIEQSNDPTVPTGRFIWFQAIDNDGSAGNHPDLSTLSGFGTEAANEAFCASPNVPNPRFGPHAVEQGSIRVR